MLLTIRQVQEVLNLLQDSHWLFIAENVNPKHVPLEAMRRLVKHGFRRSHVLSYPELAFHLGLLSNYLESKEQQGITFEQLKKAIKARKYLPLSAAEKFALRIAEDRAVEGITGLGNRISSNLRSLIIDGSMQLRNKYEKIITTEAKKSIAKRQTVKEFASHVGELTKDWSRDLDRIADFVLHEAYDNGRALAIKKQHGKEALVYKRVHEEACKSCNSLYLKRGVPRIFTVNQLLANGTNIGRKQKDWKPVVGPTHPWCRCDVEYIPSGWEWDPKTKRFAPSLLSERAKKILRKVKVKVTVS
jgi:hypothetical protein